MGILMICNLRMNDHFCVAIPSNAFFIFKLSSCYIFHCSNLKITCGKIV